MSNRCSNATTATTTATTTTTTTNTRRCDLIFVRVLHLAVHIALLALLCRTARELLWQYQTYDESIRAILFDRKLERVNVSLVIDHILNQKNDTAIQLLMHLIYISAIFVSAITTLAGNFALTLAYTLFLSSILFANLILPFITPFVTVAVFIASATFGWTYVLLYLCLPRGGGGGEHSSRNRKSNFAVSGYDNRSRRRRMGGRSSAPETPPFPADILI